MPLKLNQSSVSIKILQEKTIHIIIGEILHYIWEALLTLEKDIFSSYLKPEKFQEKIEFYLKKALASYPEPLPEREDIAKKVKEILEKIFQSKEFMKFKEILKDKEIVAIYKEPEGFIKEEDNFLDLRPDIIIKKKHEWIILEFKLHKEFEETQLENYYNLLKKIFPNDNIKIYLVSFDPFKIELIHPPKISINEKGPSYPSQLSLFKELN